MCARRAYLVELLEYGPGAYEGLLRLRAGDQEDPTGIVREMRPFPSPFRGDADGFVESMEQREAAEYDLGVRSTGAEGVCDNWLCADSEVDATLVAMQIRVEGTARRVSRAIRRRPRRRRRARRCRRADACQRHEILRPSR